MTEDQKSKLALVEMLSSVCWFLMDASWMFGLFTLSYVLAALTISTSLLLFRYTERALSDMLVTAAMACWAAMNICWMVNDSKAIDWGIIAGGCFFALGAVCLVGSFCSGRSTGRVMEQILSRFRRLRVSRRDD